jgi:hypothetical protein
MMTDVAFPFVNTSKWNETDERAVTVTWTYQEAKEGSIGQGSEPSQVGVGDEGTQQRREVKGTVEDVGNVCCRELPNVVALDKIDRQICCHPDRPNLLKRLGCCIQRKWQPLISILMIGLFRGYYWCEGKWQRAVQSCN